MPDRIKHNRREPRGLFSLFVRLGGWAAMIAGVIFLVITLIGHFSEGKADRFDREGVVTSGQVVDRRIKISTDSDGDKTRTYYLTLAFETDEGQAVEVETKVSKGTYFNTRDGGDLPIRYMASDPWLIETPVGRTRNTAGWLYWWASGFGALGLVLMWIFGRKAVRAVKTRRDGLPLSASVTGVRQLNVKINDVTQARLAWVDSTGQAGESMMHSVEFLSCYNKGDTITVYRRGAEVWWMGDVGPKSEA